MVHADPFHSYCVALVVPSRHAIENWARSVGIEYKNFAELCNQDEAVKEVQQSLLKVSYRLISPQSSLSLSNRGFE